MASPKNWLERASLLVAGASLLGSSVTADPGENGKLEELATPANLTAPAEHGSFREALKAGDYWVDFRYRYENVDQDPFTDEAHASTLRTRLGYTTGSWKGFTGTLEFSNVSNIGASENRYNDSISGTHTNRPVIADPVGSQVNRVNLVYTQDWGALKMGRQRIKLDNDRFIGNVIFRQTEQTYDALSYTKNFDSGLRVIYAYLANVNNIVYANMKSDSNLLNISQVWDNVGRLTAYGYRLDFDASPQLSTFTYGLRFAGEREMQDFSLLYTLEYAQQDDVANNTNKVDASYSHAYIGGKAAGVALKVGFETLDGDASGNSAQAFQTPLATKWAFNGWADKFLTTPGGGLEDLYVDLSYLIDDVKLGAIYHEFEGEQSGAGDYGDELDLYVSYDVNDDLYCGVKYADFNAENGNTAGVMDTTKAWAFVGYSF